MEPLAPFIHEDIRPLEGRRLLLPFLTTMDRLRLSECSKGLVNYRFHLSKVKISRHPSSKPHRESFLRGVEVLLLGQKGLSSGSGLEYLHLGDKSLFSLPRLRCFFKRLKGLECSDSKSLRKVLAAGGLEGLEELELHFYGSPILDNSMIPLGNGNCCPRLRRLVLRISHAAGAGAEIARALEGGAYPQLAGLELEACRVSPVDGLALGEAFLSGHCAKLEELTLPESSGIWDEGFMAIFAALEVGSCPNLKRLTVTSARLTLESATALGHAMNSGNCHHLELLDLSYSVTGPRTCYAILSAILQAASPSKLRYLNLSPTTLKETEAWMLGDAIGEGELPRLEELWVEGLPAVVLGLERGGCPRLKKLIISSDNMRPRGGQGLARAVKSGHLKHLEELRMVSNDMNLGNPVMAEVIQGLWRCPKLRFLDINKTGMGWESGKAVLRGVLDGCWMELEDLNVGNNPELKGVLRDDLLEESKLPRLKRLDLGNTGHWLRHMEKIMEKLERGACPNLEHVTLSGKDSFPRMWDWYHALTRRGVDLGQGQVWEQEYYLFRVCW